jgi:polar amino acid transport system substrate-binding protein
MAREFFMRLWCLAVLAMVASPSIWGQHVILACGESFPPMCFVENGVTRGIDIDLMNELAKREGLTLTTRALPWARAQQQVSTGEADAFITIATPERDTYAAMSSAVLFTVHLVAATAKSNPRIAELRRIKTLQDTLKYPQVNYVGTSLADHELAGAHVTYLTGLDAIFGFLLMGRADLFIDTDVVLSYNAARLGVTNQIEILSPALRVIEFRLGVSRKSPLATELPRLNLAIEAMEKDGTVAAIVNKYAL